MTRRHTIETERIATDDDETLRLKTLGVCVGRRVELVRNGDPLVLRSFGWLHSPSD